jgi:6-pyruvoyltetrahydropterin/6-carboxytetrahydropterin synthase
MLVKDTLSSKAVQPPSRSLPGIAYITRRAHFNAAHRLHNPDFDDAWNEAQFGLCNNPHWHGHNYLLEVTVKGQPDPHTGYIIDLSALKRILHETVVDKCDHRNLNEQVDFLKGILPSTENLVIAFWNQIEPHIPSGTLHCVRLYETERNFAEYFGPTKAS